MAKTKAILFQPRYEVGQMIWMMFANKPMNLRIEKRVFEDDGDEESEDEFNTPIINAAEQRIMAIKYVLFVPANAMQNRVTSDVTLPIEEKYLFTNKSALLNSL